MIKICRADVESGNTATSRRRGRHTGDDLTKRAKKALQLVQWGELSTARLAQQFSKAVLEATTPFQFALSTKAGTEAVTHALQALTSLTRTQPWCQSTAWALSISFPAMPWSQGSTETSCGHSSVSSTANRLHICGRMIVGSPTTFFRERTASKATLWCRCSSVWVCTRVSILCQTGCSLLKGSSHSWLTSIWCVTQSGWKLCTRSSARGFGARQHRHPQWENLDLEQKWSDAHGSRSVERGHKCTTQTPLCGGETRTSQFLNKA